MVGVSYHELQSNAPQGSRHSAGQRKQFLFLCIVGAAFAGNSFITAGLLEPVVIHSDGMFPGGEYIYKLNEPKDFASTGGGWRRISEQLQTTYDGREIFDHSMYAVYIDNVDTGFGRYFNGILIDDDNKTELKNRLIATNENISKKAEMYTDRIPYEVGTLPTVKAAYATFPYTNGFISALLHNYKVFPALYKYAKANHDKNNKIIISTTCDTLLSICTHYVPMEEGEKFFLGQPGTNEFTVENGEVSLIDYEKMFKGVKRLLGFGKKKSKSKENNEL